MLEHDVETHLVTRCREVGFLCWKFTSPGRAGVPDRVVVAPTGTVFVETKRPGGKLRRLQQEVTEKMRRAGAEVHVVDTVVGVDELVERLATRTPKAVSSRVYPTRRTRRGPQARPRRSASELFDTSEEEVQR